MDLKEQVWTALEGVLDPEVQVNIVDLGLIYDLRIDNEHNVDIDMTLTIPECPMADDIVAEVKSKAGDVPGVRGVNVNLVWEPKWTPARMNDQAIEEFRRRHAAMT